MPYMVRKDGTKYLVYKKGPDGEPEGSALGTHDTMMQANDQMAAMHAEEDKPGKQSIKALSMGEERRFGGILIPFGSPDDLDLDGEFFDADTKAVDEWFQQIGAIPFNLDHDKGRQLLKMFGAKFAPDQIFEGPVGRITKLEKTEKGWYAEGIIEAVDKLREAYADYVWSEIQAGKLNFSSGPFQPRVAKSKNGHIDEWPVIEGTGTWRPANPKSTEIIEIQSYKSALKLLRLPTTLPDEELGSEKLSEASVDKASESIDEQSRRVYQAWDEFNKRPELPYEHKWIVERYPDYVIVCEGAEHYKVPYTMNDEEVMFAPEDQWQEVRREWVAVPEESPEMGDMKAKALARLKLIELDVELLNHDLRRNTG